MSVLKEKVALVTGGSRGIGRAIAEVFASVGATVVVCGRKLYALEQVSRDNDMLPGRIVPMQCDISNYAEMESMVQTVLAEQERIDILVNNAAATIPGRSALELSEAEFDKLVEVNLKSVFRMVKLVAPGMCARGSGSIINIAATAGLKPEPENFLYSMTNAALIMMTKSYALELGPRGVRVNAIAPGLVQTEMSEYIWKNEERLARHIASQSLRHLGQPEEVAEVALMLASERSSLVTGQTFVVDAGWLLS